MAIAPVLKTGAPKGAWGFESLALRWSYSCSSLGDGDYMATFETSAAAGVDHQYRASARCPFAKQLASIQTLMLSAPAALEYASLQFPHSSSRGRCTCRAYGSACRSLGA
jgi:hypothetical protein